MQSYENIWNEIQETEVTKVFSDDVEFLLSVRVFPYPGMLCSIWVFVGYLYDSDD